jgi:RNA polymerase sigma-70 factor (ECF subfamily)
MRLIVDKGVGTSDADRACGADPPLARRGDDAASLRVFVDAAAAAVFPYLFRRCGHDRALAEDLTQEVFVAAVSALQRDVIDTVTVGWMMTTARSRLIDHYRRLARMERPLHLVASRPVEEPDFEVIGADNVESLLSALPPAQRLVVVLHHLDGLSVPEVARLTGSSVRAIESSLARARRTLRRTVEEVGDGA